MLNVPRGDEYLESSVMSGGNGLLLQNRSNNRFQIALRYGTVGTPNFVEYVFLRLCWYCIGCGPTSCGICMKKKSDLSGYLALCSTLVGLLNVYFNPLILLGKISETCLERLISCTMIIWMLHANISFLRFCEFMAH